MLRITFVLLVVCLLGCGHTTPPGPDAALPSCADLGCPGELLCSSHSACSCHGQACTQAAPADAGVDSLGIR